MIHFSSQMGDFPSFPNWTGSSFSANKCDHGVKKHEGLKEISWKRSSSERVELSCLLSPCPGARYHFHWHQREGRPQPCLCWAGEGFRCWPGLSGPAFVFGRRLLTSTPPKQGAAAENMPLSLVSTPLGPCSLQIWKKGLIVFNNMLSYTPHNTPLPPAPPSPRLEFESHLAPCSVPHYCWISLQAVPLGGTAPGF